MALCTRLLSRSLRLRHVRSVCVSAAKLNESVLPRHELFAKRHIGPSEGDVQEMLKVCGAQSMEDLLSRAMPQNIRLNRELKLDEPLSEWELLGRINDLAHKNQVYRSYIGSGYYNCITPAVIRRNVLENPGWITQYTPYQAELAQGRLESLMNFQTMVCDLTGLGVANASLLDEATAAAEAMALCFRQFKQHEKLRFFVDSLCHPQSIAVLRSRADQLGIELVVGDHTRFDFSGGQVCGVALQYPNTDGVVVDYSRVIEEAHKNGALVAMGTDLLALTMLKPPGELGADIAYGNAQRFGVPMGYGGPHAAFFAVKKELIKSVPGRIVGQTWDRQGLPTYRLSLQTREQHIRREKATSNICTAQALLANISALYAIYHGPAGLKAIAKRVHLTTVVLAEALRRQGHTVHTGAFFDTIKITPNPDVADTLKVLRRAMEKKINLREYPDGVVGLSIDESVTSNDLNDLLWTFGCERSTVEGALAAIKPDDNSVGDKFVRTSPFLQHPVFNSHQSETALVRYMKYLENLDLSLAHSMIPLGSCTLKLNATTELLPVTMPEFSSLHPFVPVEQARGYQEMFEELERDLCEITGYDKFSFQPNSGAQGELAGLCTIMAYMKDKGETQRRVCIIPQSAHGTNPASAQMAGLKIVQVPTKSDGSTSVEDFKKLIEEHRKTMAAIMVTYPSTSGVFDDSITEICDMVHHYGGQVYIDGANMNALVGICRPGDFGGDVSHLNLHKTFCIPHGGGGPGMGPIGVKSHLIPYLPVHPITPTRGGIPGKSFGSVAAAAWGSASILPISWAYIKMMGPKGLRKASEVAILNANYMASRLNGHYRVLFKGHGGFNAHEFILDAQQFKKAKVEAVDIAKRLQDYGCHAPTVSWPIPNTLMVEPTESENRDMLDKYCDALIAIREEIREIEEGKYSTEDNVLKNAPHTLKVITSTNWEHPYSREKAAFPLPWVTPHTKQWPGSGRADEIHGDKNIAATLYDKLVPAKAHK